MHTKPLSITICSAVFLILLAELTPIHAQSTPGHLTIHVDQPGVTISPTPYGMMTEEINHSYDGGLYAELIQNRSFKDDPNNPVHWSLVQDGGASGVMALDHASL